jgi:hypothetical protein
MRGYQHLDSQELYGKVWHVQGRFGWLDKNILGSELDLKWKAASNDHEEQWWF